MEEFTAEDRQRVGAYLRALRRAGSSGVRSVESFASLAGRSPRTIRGMERGERVGIETYAAACDALDIDFERLYISLRGGPLPSEDVERPPDWPSGIPFVQPWENETATVGGGSDDAGDYMQSISSIRTETGLSHMLIRYWPASNAETIPFSAMFPIAYRAHGSAVAATEMREVIYAREEGGNDAG
jgi:hypothetical protein